MYAAFEAGWADPRRLYTEARRARRMLDQAREVIAAGLGVSPPELSFLPGGPAAVRAGLDGLRYAGRRRGPGRRRLRGRALRGPARALAPGRHRGSGRRGDGARGPGRAGRPGRLGPGAERAGRRRRPAVGQRRGRHPPAAGAGPRARARHAAYPCSSTRRRASAATRRPRHTTCWPGTPARGAARPGVGILVVPARTRWRAPGPVSEAESGARRRSSRWSRSCSRRRRPGSRPSTGGRRDAARGARTGRPDPPGGGAATGHRGRRATRTTGCRT